MEVSSAPEGKERVTAMRSPCLIVDTIQKQEKSLPYWPIVNGGQLGSELGEKTSTSEDLFLILQTTESLSQTVSGKFHMWILAFTVETDIKDHCSNVQTFRVIYLIIWSQILKLLLIKSMFLISKTSLVLSYREEPWPHGYTTCLRYPTQLVDPREMAHSLLNTQQTQDLLSHICNIIKKRCPKHLGQWLFLWS